MLAGFHLKLGHLSGLWCHFAPPRLLRALPSPQNHFCQRRTTSSSPGGPGAATRPPTHAQTTQIESKGVAQSGVRGPQVFMGR